MAFSVMPAALAAGRYMSGLLDGYPTVVVPAAFVVVPLANSSDMLVDQEALASL